MTLFRCAFLIGCAMCTWLAIGFVIHHKFHKPSLQRIDLKSSLTDHTVIFAAFLYCRGPAPICASSRVRSGPRSAPSVTRARPQR
jgi:hypothetical protein